MIIYLGFLINLVLMNGCSSIDEGFTEPSLDGKCQ